MEPRDTRCSRLSWSWQRVGIGVYQRSQLQMHECCERLVAPPEQARSLWNPDYAQAKALSKRSQPTDELQMYYSASLSFDELNDMSTHVSSEQMVTHRHKSSSGIRDDPLSKSSPEVNGKSFLDDNCGAVVRRRFPSKRNARRSANGVELPQFSPTGTRNGDGTWRLWWECQKLCSNLSDRN